LTAFYVTLQDIHLKVSSITSLISSTNIAVIAYRKLSTTIRIILS